MASSATSSKPTTPPVFSGKNEDAAGWKAGVEMWSDAAIEKGATAKDIMITWMDVALAALANSDTVRVWFKGTGAASLAQAVTALCGGGERAEAVRWVTTKYGCEMRALTDAQWREALTQLWDAFLIKFGETPVHMLGRLTGMRYGEKGYDDEHPSDFIRRGSNLYAEYLDTLQRVGDTSAYSEANAINKLLGALTAVLTKDRIQRLRESIQRTQKRHVTFTWFAQEVEDQWSRQEDDREDRAARGRERRGRAAARVRHTLGGHARAPAVGACAGAFAGAKARVRTRATA